MNKFRAHGWFAKLLHFTGFMASAPGPNYDETMQEWLGPADLIIFQRNLIVREALDAIRYWQGLGKPVVVDLDDAYQMLPWSNPAHRFWAEMGLDRTETLTKIENGDPKPRTERMALLEEGLRLSNGLISPNRNLLQSFAYCVGNKQYYLQNYAEKEWWENLPERDELKTDDEKGRIVIGWGGSVSHYDSFHGSGIFEAMRRIAQRYPQVLLKICGNDRRIYEQLPVSIHQKKHQPGVSPNDWPKQVKSFDIGVAPLFGWYDQHRSWIKGIEYMLAGVPWIGTDGGPNGAYADLAPLGRLVKNTPDDWERTLSYYIDNLENEQHRYKEFIPLSQRKFIVDYNLDVFARVYKKIIKDFQESGAGREIMLPGVVHVNG